MLLRFGSAKNSKAGMKVVGRDPHFAINSQKQNDRTR
jgi:hypothetical protein